MPVSFSGKIEKGEQVGLLRRVIQTFLFPNTTIDQRSKIIEHFSWMDMQKTDMRVSCRLETVPELLLTRIVVEISYTPPPQ